ncbi:MAG: hypothetical protein AAF901_11490, partial [Bacteroidota bacterium]
MKKYFLLLFFIYFLFSSSCQKDDSGINHKIIGELNGERWEAKGAFAYNLPHNIGIDLFFDVFNSSGELREALLIYKVPFRVG